MRNHAVGDFDDHERDIEADAQNERAPVARRGAVKVTVVQLIVVEVVVIIAALGSAPAGSESSIARPCLDKIL